MVDGIKKTVKLLDEVVLLFKTKNITFIIFVIKSYETTKIKKKMPKKIIPL